MASGNSWSIGLGRIKGIPLRIHFTFFLLLAWIGYEELEAGGDPLSEILLVVGLFACVFLHELGHALTASCYGIRTRDIVLYPFGGIATLAPETKPQQESSTTLNTPQSFSFKHGPKAELIITLAGPLVNLVIATVLLPFTNFQTLYLNDPSVDFVTRLFFANIILAVFNLVPAFPMDGGRIFRAILALLKIKSATAIATRTSQILSLFLAAFALYVWNPILIIIAIFVFTTAMREHMHDKALRAASGFKVKDVMTDLGSLRILPHGATLSQALTLSLNSMQTVFPVMYGTNFMGLLDRHTLLEVAATTEEEKYISELVPREYIALSPDTDLAAITDALHSSSSDIWPVVQEGRLVGVLTREILSEFLLIHGLRKKIKEATDVSSDDL